MRACVFLAMAIRIFMRIYFYRLFDDSVCARSTIFSSVPHTHSLKINAENVPVLLNQGSFLII
jgi:hypothetical protein